MRPGADFASSAGDRAARMRAALRKDLVQAQDAAWDRIGRAGTWLTGAERVAIADESRRARVCELCTSRTAALSPFAVEGEHDSGFESPLSELLVEVVHRLSTGSGRLSRQWFDGLAVEPAIYVEALAVTATAVGIDTFHRAAGLPLRALPEAAEGEPTGTDAMAATGALDYEMAWVPTRKSFGAPNVARALSLVPDERRALAALLRAEYLADAEVLELGRDPGRSISRAQMELVAARLSVANQCFY